MSDLPTSRPSMQQDGHEDHIMPAPEHDGIELKTGGTYLPRMKMMDNGRPATDWSPSFGDNEGK